jgi:hypothetical protein
MVPELCWKPGISHIKEVLPLPVVRKGKDREKYTSQKRLCFNNKPTALYVLKFYLCSIFVVGLVVQRKIKKIS